MNIRIKLSVELYDLNRNLVMKALAEVKPETLPIRPMDRGNSIAWILGHITGSRFKLAGLLGLKHEYQWRELYADVREADVYPSIDELKAAFGEITEALKARFEALTDVELDGGPVVKIPGVEESLAGTISTYAFHESYHVGQLAYILRLHGGERLVG